MTVNQQIECVWHQSCQVKPCTESEMGQLIWVYTAIVELLVQREIWIYRYCNRLIMISVWMLWILAKTGHFQNSRVIYFSKVTSAGYGPEDVILIDLTHDFLCKIFYLEFFHVFIGKLFTDKWLCVGLSGCRIIGLSDYRSVGL